MDTVSPAAQAKGIRLRKVLDPVAGPITGDPNRLQQVVWNLLTNAIKFTPKGGQVEVLLERINSHIQITVNDSGEGIPAGFLPHVFERFRQKDSASNSKHGGLGLGLALVKNLVEMHGGTVSVKSAGEGQGASFMVCLPLRATQAAEAGQENSCGGTGRLEAGEDRPHLQGVHVLVVDDEPDARELVKRVLEEHGAAARAAASSAEGLEMLKSFRAEVIISDIGMPEQDGYDFMRAARKEGWMAPAVALTAFARPEDRLRALRAGYQMHLVKPIDPAELVTVVASLAGKLGPGGRR
jgi:CheY-like chemotaxis protein/anti-sigma regulatory factor (Ser/Thr protein kinase)